MVAPNFWTVGDIRRKLSTNRHTGEVLHDTVGSNAVLSQGNRHTGEGNGAAVGLRRLTVAVNHTAGRINPGALPPPAAALAPIFPPLGK